VTFLAVIFRSLREYDRVQEALATVAFVWQVKVKLIKIMIHHVTIKYLVHSIEWGVIPRTMCVCGTVWVIYIFSNIIAILRYHILSPCI
jgi:hypothetical protein